MRRQWSASQKKNSHQKLNCLRDKGENKLCNKNYLFNKKEGGKEEQRNKMQVRQTKDEYQNVRNRSNHIDNYIKFKQTSINRYCHTRKKSRLSHILTIRDGF